MSDDHYKNLIDHKNELLQQRRALEVFQEEKISRFKHDLRDIDKQIANCVEQIKEAQTIYHQDLKKQDLVKPGYYWGRNKWRKNPEDCDLIILVKKPNHNGIQEWYMMSRELLGWKERKDYEYTLGDYIGEER
jgi:hypothetical protein